VRAFAVEQLGDAPAILELAKPTSPDGYVVRVTHAGVNPLDYKLVDSLTSQSSYPFVLGIDFAGVLEELPSAEHELAAGDRVFGIARTNGSYAEYTAVPANGKAEALARIPDGLLTTTPPLCRSPESQRSAQSTSASWLRVSRSW
jgi:NADPH:quinone reductase-like Zn-dependent oxidoreductase